MSKYTFLFILALSYSIVYGQDVTLNQEARIEQGKLFLNQAKRLLYGTQFLKATHKAKDALIFLKNDSTAMQEVAQTYYILGIAHSARKMPNQSKIYYLAAFHHFKHLPDSSKKTGVDYTLYNSLGSLYYKTSPTKAVHYLSKALKAPHKDHLLAMINLSLAYASQAKQGNAVSQKKSLDQALKHAHQALGVLDSSSLKTMVIARNRAVIFHNMGIIYQQKLQTNLAVTYFKKSLKSISQANAPRHSLHWYNYIKLGQLYQKQGKWQTANQSFDQALVRIRKTQHHTLAHLQALGGKASTLSKYNQGNTQKLRAVLPYYYQCDSLIRHLQKTRQNYQDQLSFADDFAHTYEAAFETCFTLYTQTQNKGYIHHAFYFMERAKGQVLWLAKLKAKGSITEAKNRQWLDSLAHVRREISQAKADSHKLALFAKLAAFSQEIQPLPFYADALQSISDIQQKIKSNNTAIVSYFVASGFLYSVVISKKRVLLKSLSKLNELNALIKIFNKYAKNFGYGYPPLMTKGHKLYQQIIDPLKGALPTSGQLIIIPIQGLWKVPFDAIPVRKKMSYKDIVSNHLLSKYAISYNYSVNLWASASKSYKSENAATHFVGIAPGFNTKDCQTLRLASLPKTIPETDSIAMLYNSSLVLNAKKASLANTLEILRQKRVHTIQFATHSSGSTMPHIQLMPLSATDKYTSRLYLENIYQLRPQAQLVILSSCLSGDGLMHSTEGILGLSRGFVQTGVPTVLFSLWLVEDNNFTTPLMASFHRNIRVKAMQTTPVNYAVALQQAKIATIHLYQRAPSVSLWSGFLLITNYINQ